MSSILDRIKKRRCYPVPGLDVWVRAMTRGELERAAKLPDDLKTDFMLACVLVDEQGQPAISATAGESDEDLCRRVAAHTAETDSQTINEILSAVGRIGKPPSVETLAGN